MAPAPRACADLPVDPELGVPVPFAAGTDVGYGDRPAGTPLSARDLDKRRVTQCALSRVCGVCGATMGRPLAFLGTRTEVDRLAFHLPPAHLSCAEQLLAAYSSVGEPVLGLDAPPREWVLATTASFEFVRPGRDDDDKRPTFQPSSALAEVTPARH